MKRAMLSILFNHLKRLSSVFQKFSCREKNLQVLIELPFLNVIIRPLLKEELMSHLSIMWE